MNGANERRTIAEIKRGESKNHTITSDQETDIKNFTSKPNWKKMRKKNRKTTPLDIYHRNEYIFWASTLRLITRRADWVGACTYAQRIEMIKAMRVVSVQFAQAIAIKFLVEKCWGRRKKRA